MPTLILDYLRAVIHYWWLIVPGLFMPLSNIWKWHHPERKELPVPLWVRIGIAATAMIVAQFLAYKDSIKNLSQVIIEKRDSDSRNAQLLQKVNGQETEVARFRQQVFDLQGQLGKQNPSLKQRTLLLANKIEQFTAETYSLSAVYDDKNRNAEQQKKYDSAIEAKFQKKFAKETSQIVAEFKAKGIYVAPTESLLSEEPETRVGTWFEELIKNLRLLGDEIDDSGRLTK